MLNSIVVYRIISETADAPDMNVSYQTARALINMGIIYHSHPDYQVIREGDTTVTVYSHRKAGF